MPALGVPVGCVLFVPLAWVLLVVWALLARVLLARALLARVLLARVLLVA
jgi:hypothetical protein